MESHDADTLKKEETENSEMNDEMQEFDGTEVNIIVNDSATVNALISFDKNNYVKLTKLTIEDNDEDLTIDLRKVQAKAENILDKELSDEIEVSI